MEFLGVEWQMMSEWWWLRHMGFPCVCDTGGTWNEFGRSPACVCRLLRPLRLIVAWDNRITLCARVHVSVCLHAGSHACRPVGALTRGVGDMSVCLCMDLRLCGWAHSDMSQATSRPHKSMSLGGGILMWKWEQWFLLLNVDKKQSPLNSRPKMMDQLLMCLPSHCERVSVCVGECALACKLVHVHVHFPVWCHVSSVSLCLSAYSRVYFHSARH